MTDHEYQQDLSHTTWDEVYARQMKRADLVGEWLDALKLGEGQRLLDVGSGPGYVSLLAARRVGATGVVYAVDRSADALAFLERLQREQEITQIRRIAADAATLDPGEIHADAALVTMVLHHTDDPVKVLHAVSRVLVPGGLALIGEFHPEGPGQFGPPPAHRIGPDVVRAWAEQSGFEVVDERRQTPEHYFLLVRKKDG